MLGLFNSEYSSAFPALIVLSAGQVLNAFCGPNGNLLNLSGNEHYVLRITIVAGLINLSFIGVGAYYFNLLGAAIGATIAVVFWNVCVTTICINRLKIYNIRINDIVRLRTLVTHLRSLKDPKKNSE